MVDEPPYSVDPTEMSDIDSPEAAHDTPGPNKTKKTKKMKKAKEVQDIDRLSVRTTSIIPDQGGDGEDLEEFEQKPEDEVEIINRGRVHLRNLLLEEIKSTRD
jgi:BRCT domain type II-containing protein